ncbi:hypothetical protein Ccrd_002315 [Cynara cardunculus var. scolymus]|uniref:Uncharacterized protein n=1 Tax=Cynara cardunculus var. scolymus TaxID=59895 RepID=A0A103XRP6_CYNCS|nr:hypothetical protein Ccrd_002315 [Cynara cardunculus var. scolymus]
MRSPTPLYRRHSSEEMMKNMASVSSSLLPAFGTLIGDDSPPLKKYVIAPQIPVNSNSLMSSPLELAFTKVATGSLMFLDLVVDLFFAIDIVLTFFVAYLDKSTYLLVGDHSQIATRYVTHMLFPMDIASTLPFQSIYSKAPLRSGLWLPQSTPAVAAKTCQSALLQRDSINEMLRYASKNRLPEGLKEQLKFKTAELQQEEVMEDLPKAIRSSIAQLRKEGKKGVSSSETHLGEAELTRGRREGGAKLQS